MFTRRHFLKTGVAAGTGLVTAAAGTALFVHADQNPQAFAHLPGSPKLPKFVDPLPIPGVLKPVGNVHGAPFYEVSMTQFTQHLHRDLPPTTVWGYHGSYPGPTIEARTDEPLFVKWSNDLPKVHLLPIDHTLSGAQVPTPDVRTVVHLHEGHVPPESDGGPLAWFTPGHSRTLYYPNIQSAATLWYHDHALAITRLNVYAGLAGFYLLRDDHEDHLNLPKGAFEIALAIQDRMFTSEGQLFYPNKGITHPVWVPEFFGDTALVNGKVWPFLEVEPRKYRFRILNGCNARFLHLSLTSGQPFHQIGAEGGFLPEPVELKHILMTTAERADVILDFSGHEGETITLTNDAPAPFPAGGELVIPKIMQFRVTKPLSAPDTSSIPTRMVPQLMNPEQDIATVRDITLNEKLSSLDEPVVLYLNNRPFEAPITEKPKLGTTEIWRLINLTGDAHPIHLHLVTFHVLDRQPFDVEVYKKTKQLVFTGPRVPRAANEAGLKDTVRAMPGEVTRIRVPFKDFTGQYVYHCHILEHEDNDMMRPFEVVAN
jgi:spore coat protein A, manganese oxidase